MRNKLRSTKKCLLRLAMQADNGYTPLKLNKQNVEITQDMNTLGENNTTWKIPKESSLVAVKMKVK